MSVPDGEERTQSNSLKSASCSGRAGTKRPDIETSAAGFDGLSMTLTSVSYSEFSPRHTKVEYLGRQGTYTNKKEISSAAVYFVVSITHSHE
jgi:hypothetical protein